MPGYSDSLGRECHHDEKVEVLRAQLSAAAHRETLAERCKALGHPVRQGIMQALAVEDCCVCDLAGVLGVPVSTLSQHLRTLRGVGLVASRQDGRYVVYSLPPGNLPPLVSLEALGEATG